jgi:hypothetical protein
MLSMYIDNQEVRIRKTWFDIIKNENGNLCCSLNWEYHNSLGITVISASFFYLSD